MIRALALLLALAAPVAAWAQAPSVSITGRVAQPADRDRRRAGGDDGRSR